MNRLQAELKRLYRHEDAQGQVRAMVLSLSRPADWEALSTLWRGVQTDLALPAPAIAVSGIDGYQIWFSLLEPLSVAQARAFLDALRLRYLRGIAQERVGLLVDAPEVPALQAPSGNWSAFVAPDLAPVFADTPWLDIPPSPDGQADLLSRLASIKPADFQQALERLSPVDAKVHPRSPKNFLLEVMNDDTIELGLRIQAAKALLPYC